MHFTKLLRGLNEGIHTQYSSCAGHVAKGCISRKKMEAREFYVTFSVLELELHRSSTTRLFLLSFVLLIFSFWRKWICDWSAHLWNFRFIRSWPGCTLPFLNSAAWHFRVCVLCWPCTTNRCQSQLKLGWSPRRENSGTRTQPSSFRICLPSDGDQNSSHRHHVIPVCEFNHLDWNHLVKENCV